MRIIVFGQKWFGEEVLKMAGQAASAVGVVSREGDRLVKMAQARRIPSLPLDNQVEWPEADLGLAAHFHDRIPPAALGFFRLGIVGYHPSLLPAYPGKRAIEDAITAGDTATGGTLYRLDEGLDTGPVIRQEVCWIHPGETPAELWRRALAPLGLALFSEYLHNFQGP